MEKCVNDAAECKKPKEGVNTQKGREEDEKKRWLGLACGIYNIMREEKE